MHWGGDTTGLSKALPGIDEIEEAAVYFADIVFDPTLPPSDWVPHAIGTGGVPCGVWNDDYIPKRKISIVGEAAVEAIVIDPGGCANEIFDDEMEVHIGRKIWISYQNDDGLFSHWSAPGTLLHGCGKSAAYFVVVPSTNKDVNDELEITPITFGMLENIPIRQDDAEFAEVEVESDNDLVTIDETNRTVSGPEKCFDNVEFTR